MKKLITLISVLVISACSISLPQKEKPATTWRLSPVVETAQNQKDVAFVISKPWVASGLDTHHVLVTSKNGAMDVLADVTWSDNHGGWVRNYFLEGLQSSGLFTSVTGNHKFRGEHWVMQIYLWDLSVQYADDSLKSQPVVKLKLAYSVADRKGNKLISQRTIEETVTVSENRIDPIMQGFDKALTQSFGRVYQSLEAL